MAEECVSLIPGVKELLADKGYDTDAIRAFLEERGIRAVIPSKSNRKKKIRHNKQAYKTATLSNAASAGSRIGVASPHATISSLRISFRRSASSPPSPIGYDVLSSDPSTLGQAKTQQSSLSWRWQLPSLS
jgi:hypothetical protein